MFDAQYTVIRLVRTMDEIKDQDGVVALERAFKDGCPALNGEMKKLFEQAPGLFKDL